MEDMVENLFQQPMGKKEQQFGNPTFEDSNLASSHIVQNVLEIVDDLATQLESMLGTFEGNASHEQEDEIVANQEHEDNDEHL